MCFNLLFWHLGYFLNTMLAVSLKKLRKKVEADTGLKLSKRKEFIKDVANEWMTTEAPQHGEYNFVSGVGFRRREGNGGTWRSTDPASIARRENALGGLHPSKVPANAAKVCCIAVCLAYLCLSYYDMHVWHYSSDMHRPPLYDASRRRR